MITFADIIAPISEEEFFASYYDKKPLYIPGQLEKFGHIMNWDALNRILNMSAYWSTATLQLVKDRERIPAAAYCETALGSTGQSTMRPNAKKVTDHLHAGASLVLNDIDTLTPEVAAVADALEKTLNGKAQSNLYCSWKQRQAFFSHFDTHDVYALHFEGEKTWRIYENRMPHPIRHSRFTSTGPDFDRENRGEVMMEITMKPGDFLYLPRGWYHDALASSSGTVHIAFGVTQVIGLDFVQAMTDVVVNDELFRKNFPRLEDGRNAVKKRIAALAEKFAKMAKDDQIIDAMTQFITDYHYDRGGFALPIESREIHFKTTDSSFNVQKNGPQKILVGRKGAVPIPPAIQDPVLWIVEKGNFARSDFTMAFSSLGIDALDNILADMKNMGIIAEV
ncbi:cupin domain-containing protein [Aestuariispira ectoiniformans]|uniref:cupin domain-containing protein n=1 Tax=Aestuariispira ectoiniformans TaxID=2775080 RepID=UPI00223B015D|nr:cupin domain-containing protein [Aestuariispira ectoiniformans]